MYYRWQLLSKPQTSQVSLQTGGVQNFFTVDKPGSYRIRLVVNDGEFDSYPYDALISTDIDQLDRVRFITTGDFGTGGDKQKLVGKAMKQVCDLRGCDFILGLGDNIYKRGPSSLEDEQFETKFEQPYQAIQQPFFMVLGNHDASGLKDGDGGFNARGLIEVAYQARSEKWTMPDRYYRMTLPFNDSNPRDNPAVNPQPLVELFGLDSTPLTSMPDIVPRYRLELYQGNQGRWLDAALNNSRAHWRIAFMHHPYISNGQHGNAGDYDGISSSKYADTVQRLFPDLYRYFFQRIAGRYYKGFVEQHLCDQVDLYLSGHDHNLQWLKPVERCGNTQFIISGAGAKYKGLVSRDNNPEIWQSGEQLGFFWIDILADQLSVTIYTVDEKTGALRKECSGALYSQLCREVSI